jgi:DNA polymerase-3 subunit delta'
MSSIPSILDDIIGQEHASRFLGAVISRDQSSHAYLFLGPAGVGKEAAAVRFAAALCCSSDGCGECESCVKTLRGVHPDIEIVSATGAFITVDQVRDVNRRLSLRPSESKARVFIFTDAEAFNAESANAFLKSLEEPPPFVYFILLASSEERVLPTLVSRCQPVRFGPVPAEKIENWLVDSCDARPSEAAAFARISGGNLDMAVRLCTDSEMAARRQRYIQLAENLSRGAWEGGAAQLAAEVVSAAQDAAALEAESSAAAQVPEGFVTVPKKKLEEDAKRRARAAHARELRFALNVMESWFRDMMVMAAGAGEAVLNKDYELELEDRALPSKLDGYRRALEAIRATRLKLGYNIDVELALQAMLYQLQEVL